MTNKYLEVLTRVARQPRHVSGDATLKVTLKRADASTCEAELANFSRGGCQLACTAELNDGEAVVVQLTDDTRGLQLALPSIVRWCHPDVQIDGFAVGCQFQEELDYEHLGELFLAGFLSMDA